MSNQKNAITVSLISTLLQLSIFLQEIVLALWLIARGFNPKVVAQ